LTLSSLVPLLLASATGALTGLMTSDGSKLFYAEGIEAFDPVNLPYYLLLGVACALVSLYFKRVFALSGRLVMRWDNPWAKALTGGVLLGALIFVMPPLYGEGFGTIQFASKEKIGPSVAELARRRSPQFAVEHWPTRRLAATQSHRRFAYRARRRSGRHVCAYALHGQHTGPHFCAQPRIRRH